MVKQTKKLKKAKKSFNQRLVTAKVWCLAHKKKIVLLGVLLVFVLLTSVPTTRYFLPGLLVKKDASIIVRDNLTGEAVADADVTVDKKVYKTDATGLVLLPKLSPGKKHVIISKVFYKSETLTFIINPFKQPKQKVATISANGRLVKVTVKNRFNDIPIKGVSVVSEKGGAAKTNEKGEATLVLPTNVLESNATLSAETIVTSTVVVRAAQDALTNVFPVTPAGRLYFLSKSGGLLDVVSANLDGSDKKTILAATGNESLTDTVLIPSPDWKYVAIKARREDALPALYIIETSTNSFTKISNDAGAITPIGWVKDSFYYTQDKGYEAWVSERTILKAYSATKNETKIVDQTKAEGVSYIDYAGEYFGAMYVTPAHLVYTKYWAASYYYGSRLADKRVTVNYASAIDEKSQVVREWQAGYNSFIRSVQSGPAKFYFYLQQDGVKNSFWEYDIETIIESSTLGPESFNNTTYSAFLSSPSGLTSLWAEQRDGKNVLFIGDKKAKNQKQVATLSEYIPYGWYSEDYILLSKNTSELYIIGRDGIKPRDVPTKISDYHRPEYQYSGYGGY